MSMMTGARGLAAEMNVTPLVDVLLVLLIIFMLTPHPDTHGLETQLPQDSSAPPSRTKADTNIVVQVLRNADGSSFVRINQEDVVWPELMMRLREIYKTRATKVMFIHGDKEIEFGQIARAMDAAREADPDIAIGLLNRINAAD
jgi:biopolymer transport protein TolR